MAQIEKDREVHITNRTRGTVGYQIQDGTIIINRQFSPRQSMDLTFDELEKLSWIPGGKALLEDDFIIHDKEVVEALLGEVQPEYDYTIEDITKLMEKGSLNEFLDCLDFAPEGVLNNIKDLAISLPLNDMSKRQAILEKLGFDVTNAIELMKQTDNKNSKENIKSGKRRVAARRVKK